MDLETRQKMEAQSRAAPVSVEVKRLSAATAAAPSPNPSRTWPDLGPKHGANTVSGSSGCPVQETSAGFPQRNRAERDPGVKTSKSSRDFQGRNVGRNSAERQKRASRGAQNSAAVQANLLQFEGKMVDFPQLESVSLSKEAAQKDRWGPDPQPKPPQTANQAVGNSDPPQNAPHGEPGAAAVPTAAGKSWANVASQPPKKPVRAEQTTSSFQTEEPKDDEAPGKKKRKKKKKAKGGANDAAAEPQSPAVPLRPPKFEDELEFPGLGVASKGAEMFITSSSTKLNSEENQLLSAEPSLKKSPIGKSQKAEKVSGKKSKVPVQLDIGNMLAALEKKQRFQGSKQEAKPVSLSVGGGLPVVHKQALAQKKPPWQQEKVAHNPLDSTCPLVKKGKQREVPKAKKPTPLKKVILKEREERKQKRLLEERGLLPENEQESRNDAAEEQREENTDAVGLDSSGGEPDDPMESNEPNPVPEEEANEDKTVQQTATSPVPPPANVPKIHSRKFRDYCSQMLRKDVDECVTVLLKELVRFQDRLYHKDPIKARMKRRLVMGLREVLKHLKLRKVKCVIISPNCEQIQSKGGLDEALHTIIQTCREQAVPFVFALSRKALGHCVNKAVPVSLVGIFNYDGAQDHYHKMIELSAEARKAYEVLVSSLEPGDQQEEADGGGTAEERLSHNPTEEPASGSVTAEPEKPHYIKFWETKENGTFLNFEEQLNFLHLDHECTETFEEQKS
ncbi:selenocysteine insertion sequence-binding protein 2 isoform X3 [Oryzias latipes]|uniref:selenocysteine insertion sequence-binding protein 2 isoform X3 n=1 Tax=Oryzias latipes TaxID=8090 RepID=UPI0005CC2EE5|nr:selenocysteine insertion sequence-binding protein 2 isoform X3 [Oryzias latipes]